MMNTRNVTAVVAVLAMVLAALIAIPSVAQAQGFTAEIGSYTIPDNDGSISAPITVDPSGTGLAAVAVTVAYDPGLVSVTLCETEPGLASCNIDNDGEIILQAVEPDGWADEFVLANVTFMGLGVESTGVLDVSIGEAYGSDQGALVGEGIDGSITVSSRAPIATLTADCAEGDGRFEFDLDNPMDEAINFTIETDGVATVNKTVAPGTSEVEVVTGVADSQTVSVLVNASGGFGDILSTSEIVRCDPEVSAALSCVNGLGSVAAELVNYSGSFATYTLTIESQSRQGSFSDGLRQTLTINGIPDGNRSVVVTRGNATIYDETVSVDCSDGLPPTPTPVPPTPTPVPPTPTPTPTPGGGSSPSGANAPVEITSAVTCLAGNGRVDTNIVNTGSGAAEYRIEFGALSPRQRTVIEGDWWRMPITGRPDADFDVVVKRDGVVVWNETVTVNCDDGAQVDTPEVQIVNACRAGNGYVLFQFANDSNASKGYIIEFEGVANRSTTASAYGGAVRAVTGRPNGTYSVVIRNGQVPMTTFSVTVDCA